MPLLAPLSDAWQHTPREAFLDFLSRRAEEVGGLRTGSVRVYLGMFERLQAWLAAHDRGLDTLDQATLEAFLMSRPIAPGSRHRYLLLFTALYRDLQASAIAANNAPAALLVQTEAPDRVEPEGLVPAEVRALLNDLDGVKTWKHRRNRALFLAFLGAGLRVSEVLRGSVSLLRPETFGVAPVLDVPAHLPMSARVAPVLPFARKALFEWHRERFTLSIPGQLLFPADSGGGALSPATVFRQVRQRLERARISRRYEGPTLLRNTYGAMLIASRGVTVAQSALGHEQLDSTLALVRVAETWRKAIELVESKEESR